MEILAGRVELHKPFQDPPLSGKVFLHKQGLSYLLKVIPSLSGKVVLFDQVLACIPRPKNRPLLSRNVILLGHMLLANTWITTYSLSGKLSWLWEGCIWSRCEQRLPAQLLQLVNWWHNNLGAGIVGVTDIIHFYFWKVVDVNLGLFFVFLFLFFFWSFCLF